MRVTTLSWIIVYACVLHVAQGVAVLADPAALHITPIAGIAWIGRWGTGSVLISVAVLALLGLRSWLGILGVILALPQQALLVATAYSALAAILRQSYADGVLRPLAFIAADQIGTVLLAIVHSVAIVDLIYRRSHW